MSEAMSPAGTASPPSQCAFWRALDSAGAVVGQRIASVPGGVNGFQRAYFEVPHLPPAASYRVSVWDYDLLQSPGNGWI